MSKITPGPWTVTANDLRGGRYWTVRTTSPDHECIDLHEDDNGEANARAISAVPEMMAALEIAVRQNNCDMVMTGEELRQCCAALAKARGTP